MRPLERRPGWCVGEQYSAVVPVGNALEMQSTYSRAGRGQHCAVFAAASAHGGWCVWGAAIPQVQSCTSDAKNDICSLNSLYLSTYRIWTHTYLCISIDIYRYIHREKCIYQYLIPPISSRMSLAPRTSSLCNAQCFAPPHRSSQLGPETPRFFHPPKIHITRRG